MWYPLWLPDGTKILAVGGGLLLFDPSDNFIESDSKLWEREIGSLSSVTGPACSPTGKMIAAISDSVLWVIDADGLSQKSLVQSEQGLLTSVSWSQDGQWLAYRNEQISVVNVVDSRRQKISPHGRGPAWSPRASKIAFYYETHSPMGIYIHDFDTGRTEVIDLGPINIAHNSRPLVWSPNGRYFAFGMQMAGIHRKQPSAIFVLDVESRKLHKQIEGRHTPDSSIKWSPDGTRLLLSLV
jgi:Tol biopolymer transport system component